MLLKARPENDSLKIIPEMLQIPLGTSPCGIIHEELGLREIGGPVMGELAANTRSSDYLRKPARSNCQKSSGNQLYF